MMAVTKSVVRILEVSHSLCHYSKQNLIRPILWGLNFFGKFGLVRVSREKLQCMFQFHAVCSSFRIAHEEIAFLFL